MKASGSYTSSGPSDLVDKKTGLVKFEFQMFQHGLYVHT